MTQARLGRAILACALGALVTLASAQSVIKAEPFPLGSVKLLPGLFADANKASVDYLKTLEPDRMLSGFRVNCGLPPKATAYEGEVPVLGHYLTACSQEIAASHNSDLIAKVNYIISELLLCQKNRPDGYLSEAPNSDAAWAEIRTGAIRSGPFDLNGLRSPWAVHDKVLMGLINTYRLSGNSQALITATKFGDWMIEVTRRFTDEHWRSMLECQYGGMNEALAELYACTKKAKYLELAKKFYDARSLDPLVQGQDNLAGLHGRTQIPKVVGLARLFELTEDDRAVKATKFFWYTVIKHHTYANGGNSFDEYFGMSDQLSDRLTTNTCELCNTTNMMKLTRHMFAWNPRAEFFDYYERALLNHILTSQDQASAGISRFVPMNNGYGQEFSSSGSFDCCRGAGMENGTKFGDSIYFHQLNQRLYVNLFVPSEVSWLGQKVRQDTAMPNDGKVNLTIASGLPKTYEMAIRHPGWAKSAVQVKVNGVVVATSDKPSTYTIVKRQWKSGDKLQLTLPMSLQSVPMADNPQRMVMMFGPTVLAADLGPLSLPKPEPILFSATTLAALTKNPEGLSFSEQSTNLIFRPLYNLHGRRYAISIDPLSDSQMEAAKRAFSAESASKKEQDFRTLDYLQLGEPALEASHSLKEQNTGIKRVNERPYRTVMEDGLVEANLKSDPSLPVQLIVTYWGNERIHPDFMVLVNGQQLAIERLNAYPLNKFYEVAYKIPEETSQENTALKVQIIASPGKVGPCIAEIRLVKARG